jgi:Holliday junction DNA helicase RuvA
VIAFVRGVVVHAGGDSLVVDLGQVGVSVHCTASAARSVRHGDRVELRTSMVVREDGWTLYGFLEDDERTVFEQVQTVAGIGPRIALAVLDTMSPDDLRRAVVGADEKTLMAVPGIGRKGAQRLILELGDRLGPALAPAPADGPVAPGWAASVGAGLVSLGWSVREAEQAVAALDPDVVAAATTDPDRPDIAALLKAALRSLDRST